MRCRRGSIATTFALLAVMICGLVTLGTEVGTWYVIKRNAQNAADAAALAGALELAQGGVPTLARLSSSKIANADTSAVSFANQNGFCTNGATSCTFNGSPQTVTATVGSYSAGIFSADGSGTGNPAVRVVITQQQPGIFAAMFGQNSITIEASAVAQVQPAATACVLALSGQLFFLDNASINAPECTLAANDTASNSIAFGNGSSASVAGMTTSGGCSGPPASCAIATTYALPVVNPLAGLETTIANAGLSTLPVCSQPPTAYGTTHCRNDNATLGSGTYVGTYIFSGSLTIPSGAKVTGTATFILLPGLSLNAGSGITINVTAQSPVPAAQLPAGIPSGALDGVVLVDLDASPIMTDGIPSLPLTLNGVIFAPYATYVVYGNAAQTVTCGEVIANAIMFYGASSYTADNFRHCQPNVQLHVQVAQLVQ
jgi:Flp pilus assembly protein TadG